MQKFIVAAGTIGLLRVIGDPAGHKQARQVRPSKLSLRPTDVRRAGPKIGGLRKACRLVREALSEGEIIRERVIGIVLNKADPFALRTIEAYKGDKFRDYYVDPPTRPLASRHRSRC